MGVRHGVVVVKKGCSRPDLIKSALAQFNVGGDVTDVVLSHVTDLSGTKSISYSGATRRLLWARLRARAMRLGRGLHQALVTQ